MGCREKEGGGVVRCWSSSWRGVGGEGGRGSGGDGYGMGIA